MSIDFLKIIVYIYQTEQMCGYLFVQSYEIFNSIRISVENLFFIVYNLAQTNVRFGL